MASPIPQPAAPVSSAGIQPKQPVRNGAPSIVSAELTVTGTLTSSGDMQIDGNIDGDLRCKNLVVGETASVKGEIVAEEVVVRGRVEGSIRARKVQLCATCKVDGNILHETFAVESGALFEGNCRHSDNPLSDEAAPRMAPFARKSAGTIPADVAAKIEERASAALPAN
ncbi:MAG TPA: polymer-forming cytoskeletal protein [Rhizomicrobium sp.]|nr:polymer-forming cytoskeletal protein [Rhizomicrobium sp.]